LDALLIALDEALIPAILGRRALIAACLTRMLGLDSGLAPISHHAFLLFQVWAYPCHDSSSGEQPPFSQREP
jgi:hypothetical protein